MNKHAYLIIAHNQFDQLKLLLKQIDNKKNDIYLLIDKKSVFNKIDSLKGCVNNSNIFIYNCIDIFWGDYSQIQAELFLFKKASKNKYSYYHLLSGVDLLLKSSDEIYSFFENNANKEFVMFDEVNIDKSKSLTSQRFLYYWPIVRMRNNPFFRLISTVIVKLQIFLGIRRKGQKGINFAKGPNWVSITHEFVLYLIESENFVKRIFKHTLCCDEVFLQTILYNSPFYQNVSDLGNMRLVLWNKPDDKSPKVLTLNDFDKINRSTALFARKFNVDIDRDIVDKVIHKTEDRISLIH